MLVPSTEFYRKSEGKKPVDAAFMSISQDTDPGKKVERADLKRQRKYQLWYDLRVHGIATVWVLDT